jgi:IclR family transcriptional regulator, pca regulon regulatory protein
VVRDGRGPDFIEALSRGLAVLRSFGPQRHPMTLSEVAQATDLARPTARRVLLTLEELGYVRSSDGTFALTPRVLELGMAYVSSLGLWEVAHPHLRALVAQTHESSSMAQLDGSDIVYVARVAVPKLVTLRVDIGTRFPALRTAQGKVLLADLTPDRLEEVLDIPTHSTVAPVLPVTDRSPAEVTAMLAEVRDQGWAADDEELAAGIRSVAVPVRDASGAVHAAMDVTVHAAETDMASLLDEQLPRLQEAAARVSGDWALWQGRPQDEVG